MIPITGGTDRVERELAATRARLDDNLDAWQQRLSPGELVSQTVTYFKDGSGMELSRDIGRHMRENPIPLALIGVGVGWLMLSGKRQPSAALTTPGRSPARHELPDESVPAYPAYQAAAYDDLATKAMQAGAGLSRQADESDDSFQERVSAAKAAVLGLTRDAGEAASAFAQRVAEAMAAARDSFQRMGEQAGMLAKDAGQAAADLAGDLLKSGRAGMRSLTNDTPSASDAARGGAQQARTRTRDLGTQSVTYIQQRPLLLGALGIALGAGLGMLLPASRHERSLLGEVGAGLRERAREAIHAGQWQAARIVEPVVGTVPKAAQHERSDDGDPARSSGSDGEEPIRAMSIAGEP